jgi:carboxyl-terminal processing protease
LQGMTVDQVVEKLRGSVHTKVKLTIRRKGQDKPIELSLMRDIIRVHSVRSEVEGDDVGYIRVTQFNEQTTEGNLPGSIAPARPPIVLHGETVGFCGPLRSSE